MLDVINVIIQGILIIAFLVLVVRVGSIKKHLVSYGDDIVKLYLTDNTEKAKQRLHYIVGKYALSAYQQRKDVDGAFQDIQREIQDKYGKYYTLLGEEVPDMQGKLTNVYGVFE